MRKLLHIAAAICCAMTANAVPVTPIVQPHVTFVNAAGLPCAGCKLYSYVAGTTTALATYTDSAGVSQNPNPIILDASGGPQTPSGSSGAIWFGRSSYKLILKDPLGNTIWTVDNVNAATLFPCSPANTVQISNSGVNGLNCDPNITIDTINHTLSVGTLGANYVTIGALGTPTSWFFDTTTPATACASIGCTGTNGTVTSVSVTTANGVSGSVATATTTPAITLTLGAITPSSVALNSGTAMTGNQGTGLLVQHSTGSTITGDCGQFDGAGNIIDSGSLCGGGVSTITKPARAYSVVYQNTTGYNILVTTVATDQSACTIQAKVGNTSPPTTIYSNQTVFSGGAYDAYDSLTYVVPKNWYYEVTKITGTTCALYDWTEATLP